MATAPTSEQGALAGGYGALPWAAWVDEGEYAPDLKWPLSRNVYERMITDGQLKGLLAGITLPIRRFKWSIDKNGARPEVVAALSEQLNLPVLGEDKGNVPRRKGRFQHDRHLTDALRALVYGHYYFEQVGEIVGGEWRLKKLAPRPPRTITDIKTKRDGTLESIKVPAAAANNAATEVELSSDRLVAYIWDQEAGNWVGTSMLRACYRNWLIKDRLLRVDAIKHERSGAGTPIIEAPDGATSGDIENLAALAQAIKVTENGGGAIPHGAKARLLGVEGGLPDTVGSIRLHNEEMARSFLMMFMQLGQTETGSRALGSEFIDFFKLALEATADWYVDTFNEHVIEDWGDWNYGEDEQLPVLTYEMEASELPTADLVSLINAKAITVDPELEDAIRDKHKLPPKPEPDPNAPAPPVPPVPPQQTPQPTDAPPALDPAQTAEGRRAAGADGGEPSLRLPNRQLRRQPNAAEIAASVDFAEMDAAIRTGTDTLVGQVRTLQQAQIEELHDAIVAAKGDLGKLAQIEAAPVSKDAILAEMKKASEDGLLQVKGEAERQGVKNWKRPNIDALDARLSARAGAVDELLARSISEAAARQAIRRTAPGVTPAEVAAQVKAHLAGLSDSYLKDRLGGAVHAAMNDGRKVGLNENQPDRLYSSELLDENTCEECRAIDGTEYEDVMAADSDYPTGGFNNCQGQERCRGTVIGVYSETAPSLN